MKQPERERSVRAFVATRLVELARLLAEAEELIAAAALDMPEERDPRARPATPPPASPLPRQPHARRDVKRTTQRSQRDIKREVQALERQEKALVADIK